MLHEQQRPCGTELDMRKLTIRKMTGFELVIELFQYSSGLNGGIIGFDLN